MENPNCNFCGSSFENHTTIFTNVKNTNHNLVECNNCHLRFYSPRIPFQSYLDNRFGKDKAAEAEAEKMFNNGSFLLVKDPIYQKQILKSYYNKIVISKLNKLFPDFKTIFEIGGSVGYLAHFIKEAYPNTRIDGCELNHYSVKKANEQFGLNYQGGVFESIDVKTNYYDVVLAMDYIEHTFTPFDDLKKMNLILKPNGLIFMKTFLEELDINRTMEAPIGHSHHFFGHVLRSMIEKCGFKILEWALENEQVIIVGKKNG